MIDGSCRGSIGHIGYSGSAISYQGQVGDCCFMRVLLWLFGIAEMEADGYLSILCIGREGIIIEASHTDG